MLERMCITCRYADGNCKCMNPAYKDLLCGQNDDAQDSQCKSCLCGCILWEGREMRRNHMTTMKYASIVMSAAAAFIATAIAVILAISLYRT